MTPVMRIMYGGVEDILNLNQRSVGVQHKWAGIGSHFVGHNAEGPPVHRIAVTC